MYTGCACACACARACACTLQVEYDLPRTFPQHADFMPAGGGGGDGAPARVDTPTLASLRRVLLAFAAYEPSVGYCQSLNFVAAMLILVGGEEGGFWMLAAICANVIPDYHTHQMTGLRIDTQVADAPLTLRMLCTRHASVLHHCVCVHCVCTACALHVHCMCTGLPRVHRAGGRHARRLDAAQARGTLQLLRGAA